MTRVSSLRLALLVLLTCLGLTTLGTATSHAADFASEVRTGTLPIKWITGGPLCPWYPEFQVHAYNDDFYILRESGCVNDEKPFLYLIFGDDRALLLDTGAGVSTVAGKPDVIGAVKGVIASWLRKHKRKSIALTVSHLHSHGDHTYGDSQFANQPNITLVPNSSVPALQAAFGITNWPTQIGSIELGNRTLDIIPIPGHDATSIAVYDRETAILLTGDTLYPGRVYVNGDPDTFAASVQRMVDFTRTKIVAHILGTHIEQKEPYIDYPVGTTYAPIETPLALSRGNLLELLEATKSRTPAGKIVERAFRDFSVCGSYPNCNSVNK